MAILILGVTFYKQTNPNHLKKIGNINCISYNIMNKKYFGGEYEAFINYSFIST